MKKVESHYQVNLVHNSYGLEEAISLRCYYIGLSMAVLIPFQIKYVYTIYGYVYVYNKQKIYRYEICFDLDPKSSSWTPCCVMPLTCFTFFNTKMYTNHKNDTIFDFEKKNYITKYHGQVQQIQTKLFPLCVQIRTNK